MFERLDWLQGSQLFRDVPEDLLRLVADSPLRRLRAGEVLLEAGEHNQTLYFVLDGRLGLHIGGHEIGEAHLEIGPGDCAGELSLLDGQNVPSTIVATTDAEVLAIPEAYPWALIDQSPEFARNLLAILTGRVRHDTEALAESARLRQHFERAATVDGLTGLRNRRWLEEAFARQLTRSLREGRRVSLLMIDVDRFKVLNDTYGHLVGDAVLCRLARVLAVHLRPNDLLGRYGGEEFLLLLPDTQAVEALEVAERLREQVSTPDPVEHEEPLPTATISIGLAMAPPATALPDLIAAADAALYRAKRAGRNRVSD